VRRIVARVAAPVVFLAAVTAVVLILRSGLHETAAVAPAPAADTKLAHAKPKVTVKRHYYRLQPGDTLDTVARHYRTSVHQLLLFNPGVHAETIVPGQKLRVR
jgi:LysM repeat protein